MDHNYIPMLILLDHPATCTVKTCDEGLHLGSPTTFSGGRRSPAVACWASDHWVTSSNPLGGKFRH